MATPLSILAWRIRGQRSLAGCSPRGLTEPDTPAVTEDTHTHQSSRTLAGEPGILGQEQKGVYYLQQQQQPKCCNFHTKSCSPSYTDSVKKAKSCSPSYTDSVKKAR